MLFKLESVHCALAQSWLPANRKFFLLITKGFICDGYRDFVALKVFSCGHSLALIIVCVIFSCRVTLISLKDIFFHFHFSFNLIHFFVDAHRVLNGDKTKIV